MAVNARKKKKNADKKPNKKTSEWICKLLNQEEDNTSHVNMYFHLGIVIDCLVIFSNGGSGEKDFNEADFIRERK